MRNLLGIAGLTSLLIAAPLSAASAADMGAPYTKAPPPPPPAVSWTGCYVDGGIGYGMSNLDQNDYVITAPGYVPGSVTYTDGGRGWLGRLGAGCDYQMSNWVVGVFGDYDFMDIHRNFSPGTFASAGDLKENDAWYVGGRIGYLITPGLLAYWDGGYTETHFEPGFFGPLIPGAATVTIPGHTYSGWFLGGGTEYALNFDWLPIHGLFWRNEYRFSEYDSANLPVSFATGAPTGNGENIHPYVQTITSSLIWRFNWGGPVATRY
jgi:outer membrane immunogenic protein